MSQHEIDDLRFDLLRNAIYHTSRAQFFDLLTRLTNLSVIVLGASIMVSFVNANYLALAVTVVGAFTLVGNFGVAARDHAYLQRRSYELMAELDSLSSPTAEEIAAIKSKLTILYGEEPPPMKALNAIAYNAACDFVGKRSGSLKIEWYQSLLRHFIPFTGTEFYRQN